VRAHLLSQRVEQKSQRMTSKMAIISSMKTSLRRMMIGQVNQLFGIREDGFVH
jgi:hypothetical protein